MSLVLIVDDDVVLLSALDALIKTKSDTLVADSGAAALELLRTNSVDVMVLDINMPGISGFEVLRQMQDSAEGADRPAVIVFSANRQNRTKAMELGAVAFVDKGNPDELFPLIERYASQV